MRAAGLTVLACIAVLCVAPPDASIAEDDVILFGWLEDHVVGTVYMVDQDSEPVCNGASVEQGDASTHPVFRGKEECCNQSCPNCLGCCLPYTGGWDDRRAAWSTLGVQWVGESASVRSLVGAYARDWTGDSCGLYEVVVERHRRRDPINWYIGDPCPPSSGYNRVEWDFYDGLVDWEFSTCHLSDGSLGAQASTLKLPYSNAPTYVSHTPAGHQTYSYVMRIDGTASHNHNRGTWTTHGYGCHNILWRTPLP